MSFQGRRIKTCVIGHGYWGPNLVRNLLQHRGFEIVGIIDLNPHVLSSLTNACPQIPTFTEIDLALEKLRPEAAIIATPPATHLPLALKCIKAGAHILLEKPMALSTAECDEIILESKKAHLKVMVDHTFMYHPAVQCLAKEVHTGALGDLLYYDSVRVNLGKFQTDTNVLWDLAPHDLSILDLLLKGKMPKKLTAHGIKHFNKKQENLCYLHMIYERNFVAHLHLNWVAPIKIRSLTLGGSRKMAVYDEGLPIEKLKIYDKGVSVAQTDYEARIHYRLGDMLAPALPATEPLFNMVSKFHSYMALDERPISDALTGKRIVQIIEAASMSLLAGGETISVNDVPLQSISKAA